MWLVERVDGLAAGFDCSCDPAFGSRQRHWRLGVALFFVSTGVASVISACSSAFSSLPQVDLPLGLRGSLRQAFGAGRWRRAKLASSASSRISLNARSASAAASAAWQRQLRICIEQRPAQGLGGRGSAAADLRLHFSMPSESSISRQPCGLRFSTFASPRPDARRGQSPACRDTRPIAAATPARSSSARRRRRRGNAGGSGSSLSGFFSLPRMNRNVGSSACRRRRGPGRPSSCRPRPARGRCECRSGSKNARSE